MQNYDVVILGSGPAGEGAAMKLAKEGRRVAVVEERPQVGGACAHAGTIPSKALRQSVWQLIRYSRDPLLHDTGDPRHFSFAQLLARARKVIDQQVDLRTRFYTRNDVELVFSRGTFLDAHHIEVRNQEGGRDVLAFEHAIIATGARPYHPQDIDFTHARVFDSDNILKLDVPVRKIIIYGAGVIGCEYASIFEGMGVKVDLINTQTTLLSFLDDEISDALSHYLRELGVLVRNNEHYAGITTSDEGVVLDLKSGKKIRADAILWCNGRTGNTQDLGLEALGVEINQRGQIHINERYQTTLPHIYAAGDVIVWPALASAAYDQGRCAAAHIVGATDVPRVSEVPTGIYTIPEISSLGQTEAELTRAQIPYEVGQAFFRHLARAQITGETVGMLKILFHRETLEILGIHCFGDGASEIVHIGQAVMHCGQNNLQYFANTTFNYPTMAEAYRVAALNGLNRLF